MSSMGLKAKSLPAGLNPGEVAVAHPPAHLRPRNPAPPQNMIRDLLQRLKKEPTAVEPPPRLPPEQPLRSVLRQ